MIENEKKDKRKKQIKKALQKKVDCLIAIVNCGQVIKNLISKRNTCHGCN